MDEILKKLLDHELLSEENRAEISGQIDAYVATFKSQVREEVSAEVRTELAEQWVNERDELITKLDTFVTEAVTTEFKDLKDDVERYRDLEVEYATKIVEEKTRLAEEVAKELDSLVDKMDAFFELRLSEEFKDLKEDLEVVKQNKFGQAMFEAYASTFAKNFVDEDSVQAKLSITESKLADAEAQLASLEDQRNKMIRESKMEQVLSNLTGKKREQMAIVLKNVDTDRLEESYKFFIGRILKEDTQQINEATTQTTVKTGDDLTVTTAKPEVNQSLLEAKRIAGLI